MELVEVPPAMLEDMRKKTVPLEKAFIKRVPAAEKPIKAYLAEMKRA